MIVTNIGAVASTALSFVKEFLLNSEEAEDAIADVSVVESSILKTAETSDNSLKTLEFAMAEVLIAEHAINSAAYSRCLVFLGDIG